MRDDAKSVKKSASKLSELNETSRSAQRDTDRSMMESFCQPSDKADEESPQKVEAPPPINEDYNRPLDIRRHHVNTINI